MRDKLLKAVRTLMIPANPAEAFEVAAAFVVHDLRRHRFTEAESERHRQNAVALFDAVGSTLRERFRSLTLTEKEQLRVALTELLVHASR